MSIKVKKVLPDNEINQLLYKNTTNSLRRGYIEVGDEGIIMPEYYEEIADEIDNFQVNDSDVFVMSYPKTGTTWTQEMVWLLLNDVDRESAVSQAMSIKAPFLEFKGMFDFRAVSKTHPEFTPPKLIEDSIKLARDYKGSPRLIKTHLPWCLLPKQIRDGTKKPKIIYTCRNPKDTCISFYYHHILLSELTGNFEEYCELFLQNKLIYGSFWNHVIPMWEKRGDANILFIFYEDMKTDLVAVLNNTAAHVDKPLTHSQIEEMMDHLSFETMKKNFKGVNWFGQLFGSKPKGEFMRRGIVGSYKDQMSLEIAKRFDKWIEENTKGTELHDQFNKF